MFTLILVICVAFTAVQSDSNCPRGNKADIPSVKLKIDLLCDYDNSIRPVKDHTHSTNLTFNIIMTYFTYDHLTSTMSINSWIAMNWKDEHLTWKPEDYSKLDLIHFHSSELWTPDLSVYNRVDQGVEPKLLASTDCQVYSEGNVACVPAVRVDALCIADLRRYPFDTQNCTIRFGSWVHKGEELNIDLSGNMVDMEDMVDNGEWKIVKVSGEKYPGIYECCPNETYPTTSVSFIIKRLSGAHAASVIIPAFVAIIVTLTSLWISPTNKDRLVLCSVNLLTQFFHLQYVSWMVPLRGDNVPYIICFARDSLLLCGFTILLSVMLNSFSLKKTAAPVWVSSTAAFLLSCPLSNYIFLNDSSAKELAAAKGDEDGVTIIDNSAKFTQKSHDWIIFANLLDRLCFIIYCIVYFVMIIGFVA